MWKILLTVFKINTQALSFYHSMKFGIDANSPSSYGNNDNNIDYEILSDKPKKKITTIATSSKFTILNMCKLYNI